MYACVLWGSYIRRGEIDRTNKKESKLRIYGSGTFTCDQVSMQAGLKMYPAGFLRRGKGKDMNLDLHVYMCTYVYGPCIC